MVQRLLAGQAAVVVGFVADGRLEGGPDLARHDGRVGLAAAHDLLQPVRGHHAHVGDLVREAAQDLRHRLVKERPRPALGGRFDVRAEDGDADEVRVGVLVVDAHVVRQQRLLEELLPRDADEQSHAVDDGIADRGDGIQQQGQPGGFQEDGVEKVEAAGLGQVGEQFGHGLADAPVGVFGHLQEGGDDARQTREQVGYLVQVAQDLQLHFVEFVLEEGF